MAGLQTNGIRAIILGSRIDQLVGIVPHRHITVGEGDPVRNNGYTIPNGVTLIGNNAFDECSISSIIILLSQYKYLVLFLLLYNSYL